MKIILALLLSLALTACGSGSALPSVYLYGDSTQARSDTAALQALTGRAVVNRGVDGISSFHMLGTFADSLAGIPKGSIVVVNWGINDAVGEISTDKFIANIQSYERMTREAGLVFVLETPNPIIRDSAAPGQLRQFVEAERALGFALADQYAAIVTDYPNWQAAMEMPWGVHPLAELYAFKAQVLANAINAK